MLKFLLCSLLVVSTYAEQSVIACVGSGCASSVENTDSSGELDGPCTDDVDRHKHKHPFTSPLDELFIQERASKGLSKPGQHTNFGALAPWPEIHDKLDSDRKLLFLVRHGTAWSNYWQKTLGPDVWYDVVKNCKYTSKNNKTYEIFDSGLAPEGKDEAKLLAKMLKEGGWFTTLTGGRPTRAVASPLTRVLDTAAIVLDKLPTNTTIVEEYVRETLGSDTCDARRSLSDPAGPDSKLIGPCNFTDGLRTKYPDLNFKLVGEDKAELGLVTDADTLWTRHHRERQHQQRKRARNFLYNLFDTLDEQVVFVMTHSGFTRSLLLEVGREPYRPVNSEVVPLLVEYRRRRDVAKEE